MTTTRRSEHGGALLAVLWLSAALAAVAFSLAGTVKGETERTATAVDDVRSYYLATGAIERAILRMQWAGHWYIAGQPVFDFEFPSGKVHVEIIAEAAKLNVNQASPDQLVRLITAVTHDEARAQEITAGIVDWRRSSGPGGGGAFDGFYLNQNPSFRPRHASIEEIEELLAVRGMTPDAFYGTYVRDTSVSPPQLVARGGLRDALSIYGGVGVFEINGASPELMQSNGVPADLTAAVVANRPFLSATQYALFSGGNPALARFHFGGNTIYTIRATARLRLPNGKLGDLRRSASALVKFQSQKDPPYVVLRWYDRG